MHDNNLEDVENDVLSLAELLAIQIQMRRSYDGHKQQSYGSIHPFHDDYKSPSKLRAQRGCVDLSVGSNWMIRLFEGVAMLIMDNETTFSYCPVSLETLLCVLH